MYSGSAYSSFGTGLSAYSNYGSLSTANISYETNSKDPVLLRARVFVGNMNPKVGREEIIQLFRTYGTLLGVTVFKGYAFVQFSHGSEADLAVSALHGYTWHGSVLDCKLAVSGQGKIPVSASNTPGLGSAKTMGQPKRNQQNQQHLQNATPKKMKVDYAIIEKANKTFAENMNIDELESIFSHDCEDTMICGACRFVTKHLAEFVEHRKHPCKVPKPDGEPDALLCGSCNEEFPSSWALLQHASVIHSNSIYKEVFYPKTGENGANSSDLSIALISGAKDDVSMDQK